MLKHWRLFLLLRVCAEACRLILFCMLVLKHKRCMSTLLLLHACAEACDYVVACSFMAVIASGETRHRPAAPAIPLIVSHVFAVRCLHLVLKHG